MLHPVSATPTRNNNAGREAVEVRQRLVRLVPIAMRVLQTYIAWGFLSLREKSTSSVSTNLHLVMDRAPQALSPWRFDCASLDSFRLRLKLGHLPADDIVSIFEREKMISGTLRHLSNLV